MSDVFFNFMKNEAGSNLYDSLFKRPESLIGLVHKSTVLIIYKNGKKSRVFYESPLKY